MLGGSDSAPLDSRILDGAALYLNASTNLDWLIAQENGLPSQETLARLHQLQTRLGGVRKIVWVLGESSYQTLEADIARITPQISDETVRTVAVSLIGVRGKSQSLRNAAVRSLVGLNHKMRYVDPQEGGELSTAQTYGNKLALATAREGISQRARELAVLSDGQDGLLIGVVATVQDIAAYSQRDREMPAVDAYNGLLPVKLAQLMMNLAVEGFSPEDVLVVDPCCGNGRILFEASHAGFAALGSDNAQLQVDYSQQNAQWWAHRTEDEITVELRDTTSSETLAWAKAQAGEKQVVVCTEPWLGTPARQRFDKAQAEKWYAEVRDLYTKIVINWMTKDGAKQMLLVVPAPVLVDGGLYLELVDQVLEEAKKLGLAAEEIGAYRRADTYIGRVLVQLKNA